MAKGWLEVMQAGGTERPEHKMLTMQGLLWSSIAMPMWKMRCEVQHGRNSGAWAQVMEKLGERMNWYMANRHELLAYHDRRLAKYSMVDIHRLNRRQRVQWVKY